MYLSESHKLTLSLSSQATQSETKHNNNEPSVMLLLACVYLCGCGHQCGIHAFTRKTQKKANNVNVKISLINYAACVYKQTWLFGRKNRKENVLSFGLSKKIDKFNYSNVYLTTFRSLSFYTFVHYLTSFTMDLLSCILRPF